MKVYHFESLLGTVYRKGNIEFLPGGDKLVSPVGNRITHYELKRNESNTLSVEGSHNYTAIAISPNGKILVAGNEIGEIHVISLSNNLLLHCLRMDSAPTLIRFAPDGTHFAIVKGSSAFIYESPTQEKCFNPFIMKRVFHDATDDLQCLDWSVDSRLVLIGGRDMMLRVYSMKKFVNFKNIAFTGHTDVVIYCFFVKDSYDAYTLSGQGLLCRWKCSVEPKYFIECQEKFKFSERETSHEIESYTVEVDMNKKKDKHQDRQKNDLEVDHRKAYFTREKKYFYMELFLAKGKRPNLECADYNKTTKLLVTGFADGSFFIHDLPAFSLLQSLSISEHKISTVSINDSGDWIAFGCPTLGQLLVWEWQSETYVLKQQGHFDTMNVCAYSSDGRYIVTGGEDGKVKVWESRTSFCFVTFTEHTSSITGVVFIQGGHAVISSSLDGTVRAFDMTRYRNFRTFTSPKPAQFSCVSVDSSGEFLAAGAFDVFDVFLWSVKTGRLLEILNGHEGPVAGIAFTPTNGSTQLASVSWDKTLRIWEAIESTSNREIIQLSAEGTCLAYRPDGHELAVGTLDCHISFLEPKDGKQRGSIEGRNHLGAGRLDTDLVTSKKNLATKAFTTLTYSPDGIYLLAGGQSKNVCYYDAARKALLMKYEITQNKSLDGMNEFVHHRKMTEFGNMSLLENRDELSDSLKLPGVRKGDMAARSFKPEVRVSCVRFSPTGSQWVASSTEGLLLYNYDTWRLFMPIEAGEDVNPDSIAVALTEGAYDKALLYALHLNLPEQCQKVMEGIPLSHVHAVCDALPPAYRGYFLKFLGDEISISRHFQFYLIWAKTFLKIHLKWMKHFQPAELTLALNTLEKNVVDKREDIMSLATQTKSAIDYLLASGQTRKSDDTTPASPISTLDSNHSDTSSGSGDYSEDDNEVESLEFNLPAV